MGFEKAPSGRAKCGGCKKAITRGEWRFAEEVFYGHHEQTRYWHPPCAAERRWEGVSKALSTRRDLPAAEHNRLWCQVALRRCGEREAQVTEALWLAPDEDGWTHLLCRLDCGSFAVVTDLNGEWKANIEQTQDDAVAIFPDLIFELAASALGGAPVSQRKATRAVRVLRKRRKKLTQARNKELGRVRREATRKNQAEAKALGRSVSGIGKGTRVEILADVKSTQGQSGKGAQGVVFWSGYTKTGVEKRVGLKSADGQKYWANVTDVTVVEGRAQKLRAKGGGKKTIRQA